MMQLPVFTSAAAKQVRRPYMVASCIWIGATAMALFHATNQFFQPMQQNRFEIPSQLHFRPQTTQWSPFGQPSQQSFSWPLGGDAQPTRNVFTASSVGAFAAVIMAVTTIGNALSPLAAVGGTAISGDTNITSDHFSLLPAVGTTATTKAVVTKPVAIGTTATTKAVFTKAVAIGKTATTKAVVTKHVAVGTTATTKAVFTKPVAIGTTATTEAVVGKPVAREQTQGEVKHEQIAFLSTVGTSTTKAVAAQQPEATTNFEEYGGTDLSGVFDEGPFEDKTAYGDFCQTDGIC